MIKELDFSFYFNLNSYRWPVAPLLNSAGLGSTWPHGHKPVQGELRGSLKVHFQSLSLNI